MGQKTEELWIQQVPADQRSLMHTSAVYCKFPIAAR